MQRRTLRLESMDQLLEEIERLRSAAYGRLGNWSLGQTCDHLAIFFRGSLDGFDQPRFWWSRLGLGRLVLWLIFRRGGMPTGIRVPDTYLPGDTADDTAAVVALEDLVRRFRDHTGPVCPSPVFGNLSYRQWQRLHLIHAAHHLSFLLPRADGT